MVAKWSRISWGKGSDDWRVLLRETSAGWPPPHGWAHRGADCRETLDTTPRPNALRSKNARAKMVLNTMNLLLPFVERVEWKAANDNRIFENFLAWIAGEKKCHLSDSQPSHEILSKSSSCPSILLHQLSDLTPRVFIEFIAEKKLRLPFFMNFGCYITRWPQLYLQTTIRNSRMFGQWAVSSYPLLTAHWPVFVVHFVHSCSVQLGQHRIFHVRTSQ